MQSSASIVLLLWFVLLASTSVVVVVSGEDLPSNLTVAQRHFADDLTSLLYDDDTNECTSSLGISMMFSLLYPATTGQSQSQIRSVLGFPTNHQQLVWDAVTTALNEQNDGTCIEEVTPQDCFNNNALVSISNSVWIDQNNDSTAINPDYQSLLGDNLLNEIDMGNATAGTTINEWVQDATRNLIDSIVDNGPLNPIILLVINAIYIKANWMLPFEPQHTNVDLFYGQDGATVTSETALFMHQVDRFYYSETAVPNHQVVELPFANSDLSMVIALPLSPAATTTTSSAILEALPKLESRRVALALPKLVLEREYRDDLKQALMSLGMEAPFAGGICVYKGDCSPFLSFVVQKTFFAMDEEGVEAAAVTAGAVTTSVEIDQPVLFLANKPFQFWIHDAGNDVTLFEGRITDPTAPTTDATAPVLSGKHADADFWTRHFFVEPKLAAQVPTRPSPSPVPATTTTPPNDSPTPVATTTTTPIDSPTASPVPATTTTPPNDSPTASPVASAASSWVVSIIASCVVAVLV